MSKFMRRWVRCVASCLILNFAVPLPLLAGHPPIPFVKRVLHLGKRTGTPPITGRDHAVEKLAKNIDWLEHELDRWGTVVAKTPDVWGEARLTKYRREVEERLANEVKNFEKGRLSGAQFVSDQAFLAAAASIKSEPGILDRRVAAPTTSISIATSSATAGDEETATTAVNGGGGLGPLFGMTGGVSIGDNIKLEQTAELDQMKRYLDHLNELRRINEGDDTADAPGYSMNLVRIPISILPGSRSNKGYGAEITVTATPDLGPELLPRVFRDMVINDLVDQLAVPLTKFLNQDAKHNRKLLDQFYLRENPKAAQRYVNEQLASFRTKGLLKWPLNVIVRERTKPFVYFDNGLRLKEDIQVETENLHHLVAEILHVRNTFRDMVEEAQIAAAINASEGAKETLEETPIVPKGLISLVKDKLKTQPSYFDENFKITTQSAKRLDPQVLLSEVRQIESAVDEVVQEKRNGPQLEGVQWMPQLSKVEQKLPRISREIVNLPAAKAYQDRNKPDDEEPAEWWRDLFLKELEAGGLDTSLNELGDIASGFSSLDEALSLIPTVVLPSTSTRRAVLPFPPSQLIKNYGLHELAHVALQAYQAFDKDVVNRQVIHLTDVQSYLREELAAAYERLSIPMAEEIWQRESLGDRPLYTLLRGQQASEIEAYRECFIEQIGQGDKHDPSTALAWCVLVDSVLLNERLIQDIRQTTSSRGNLMPEGTWHAFFGPNPNPEARSVFAEYAKQRWPVKVFTVDPVNNEQNIADSASFYREMQLSVALAFAAGEIGASGAMQTLRKLQRDAATVDLNRTIVGFSHGDDTFGWRFFPRFQTPPVEGNATVFFRDLVAGGPTDKQLTRGKQLEPGMRECVAIVIMPSFVSHVTFDTRGNWFKLSKPGHSAHSVREAVHYSRAVQSMRTSSVECAKCQHLYREGEVQRLLRRVDQLDRELPLQTLRCQVPDEMTLGGFEILSSGTRELAPELLGWYGAPGYDQDNGASFFLAGDNFSVHETELIVGNKPILGSSAKLLSRQILQVTLPKGLPVIKDERLVGIDGQPSEFEGFIDAVVATPYGASGHLLIPALRKAAKPTAPTVSQLRIATSDVTLNAKICQETLTTGEKIWTLKDQLVQDNTKLSLLTVEAAKGSYFGKAVKKANIVLELSRNSDRLRTVEIKDVLRDGQKYVVSSPQTIDAMSGGALQKSVNHYLTYVMNHEKDFWKGIKTGSTKAVEIVVKGGIVADDAKLGFENSVKLKIKLNGYQLPASDDKSTPKATIRLPVDRQFATQSISIEPPPAPPEATPEEPEDAPTLSSSFDLDDVQGTLELAFP